MTNSPGQASTSYTREHARHWKWWWCPLPDDSYLGASPGRSTCLSVPSSCMRLTARYTVAMPSPGTSRRAEARISAADSGRPALSTA